LNRCGSEYETRTLVDASLRSKRKNPREEKAGAKVVLGEQQIPQKTPALVAERPHASVKR
jgi:hypothetical protein